MSIESDADGCEAAESVISRLVNIYVETGEPVPHDVYVAHEWVQEQQEALYE